MPRDPEKNALVREERKRSILKAALCVYVRCGYHGTDMDDVAGEAQLAKGLIYYYFKTKKELFTELYSLMFNKGTEFSNALIEYANEFEPVEQLMRYAYGMFVANKSHPRMMQFFLRAPFDAYAVFGSSQWTDGAAQSDAHQKAITQIIERGIKREVIPVIDASGAANSFWAVYVANLFQFSKLIIGSQDADAYDEIAFRETVRFCFQGLGIEFAAWNACLEKVIEEGDEGGPAYEGL